MGAAVVVGVGDGKEGGGTVGDLVLLGTCTVNGDAVGSADGFGVARVGF